MTKTNIHNSSTTPIRGEVRLHETNRLSELQWRDHVDLLTLEGVVAILAVWLLVLTLVVLF